ncbi:MAG: DUF402 domain-containing protein [Dehalococcoidia bacterium]
MSVEDTSARNRDASGAQITERKVKADGSVQEFPCTLIHRGKGFAVVRFVMARPGMFPAPVPLPGGTVSDGWFWENKPYSLYRMRGPGGTILAHRLDAVGGVEISESVLTFRDHVLDWWVLPDGRVQEEDADELDALVARGIVKARDLARAERARRDVLSRYRHIIDNVAATERKLGLWQE